MNKSNMLPLNMTFHSNINKQKLLIDVLMNYSTFNYPDLSFILNISKHTLENIHKGESFLIQESANNLTIVFLAFFFELD